MDAISSKKKKEKMEEEIAQRKEMKVLKKEIGSAHNMKTNDRPNQFVTALH